LLTVAGAGMAGLAAAARARELGVPVRPLEKGDRPGGSMRLSSGVIWRYRTFADFRRECPQGDEDLQRTVFERLDEAIEWLRGLGAPVVWEETGNPLTTGQRFDPNGLTEALVRALGVGVETGAEPTGDERPLLLATGGFQGDPALVAEHVRPAAPLRLRANRWSAGDGLRLAQARGAGLSAGMGEFYGRNMADVRFTEEQFVPLAQLYGRHARVFNEHGEEFYAGNVSWSENDLVQATARELGARAWYVLDDEALGQRVRDRTVEEIAREAPTATDLRELPFEPPPEARVAVRVAAAITHTIGGVRIDDRARVLDEAGEPIDGLFAAGADAGGISTGGYASGLAAALVFGRIAAETAAA
jgi:fumarate reductase flavoprotein subunit